MSYYEEDDELDIIRVHRGRAPAPIVYPEDRYRPSARLYNERTSNYLEDGPRLRGFSPLPRLPQESQVPLPPKQSAGFDIPRPASANNVAEFSRETWSFSRNELNFEILQKFGIPYYFDREASVRGAVSVLFLLRFGVSGDTSIDCHCDVGNISYICAPQSSFMGTRVLDGQDA